MRNSPSELTRRMALGVATAAALARPALIRARAASMPIRIGLLSDVTGPYRNVNGPGGKVAVELAVGDFGGTLLGRTIDTQQADIQNKPDIASAQARTWIDGGFNVLVDGGATSSGLAVQEVAREKKTIYLGNGPSATEFTGKFCSPYGFHCWANT
jgi:branched-chain amino acid transport system substrate-binding protein